jgi:hypothetical protein
MKSIAEHLCMSNAYAPATHVDPITADVIHKLDAEIGDACDAIAQTGGGALVDGYYFHQTYHRALAVMQFHVGQREVSFTITADFIDHDTPLKFAVFNNNDATNTALLLDTDGAPDTLYSWAVAVLNGDICV